MSAQRLTVRADEVRVGDGIDTHGYSGVVVALPEWEEVEAFDEIKRVGHITLDSFGMFVNDDDEIKIVRWDK